MNAVFDFGRHKESQCNKTHRFIVSQNEPFSMVRAERNESRQVARHWVFIQTASRVGKKPRVAVCLEEEREKEPPA